MDTLPLSLPLDLIIVLEDRQRQSNREVDDQFVASISRHLINPITLRKTDAGPTLVAGERRLIALKKAGLTTLEHGVHFRFLEDLTPEEAEILELEENVKREELYWRDRVRAAARIHSLLSKRPGWTGEKTARELSISKALLSEILFIFRNLDSPNLSNATSIRQAYAILQGISERRTVAIVQDIAKVGTRLFEPKGAETPIENDPIVRPIIPVLDSPQPDPIQSNRTGNKTDDKPQLVNDSPQPILNEDFIKWAATYSGDKFTLIHCDFPYDIKYDSYARSVSSVTEDYDFSGYWPLMDALCDNLDRLMSYSAHLMLWFSMKFYQQTRERLEKAGLYVHDHPLIWHKTDNAGIIPGRDGIFPRRTYETALLATRGRRPLVRSLANIHGAPMASGRDAIHPSQKPIPVLKHFFGMLVDESTEVLDPTVGSGTSLIAAEQAGARRIVGLELNSTYCAAANAMIATTRTLRRLSK